MAAVFVDLRFELEALFFLLCLLFPLFPQSLLFVPAVLLELFVEGPWHDHVSTLDRGYSPTLLHFSIPRGVHIDQFRLEGAPLLLSPLLVPLRLHHYALLVFHSRKALQVHSVDWGHAIGISVFQRVPPQVVLPSQLFFFIHLIGLPGHFVLDQVCLVESFVDRASIGTVLTHLLSDLNRVLADLWVVARALHVRVI